MSSHVQRLKGSDLLLRKIPLYTRAKDFAEVSLDDPHTESNSLSYDGELYRVLSLLRTADVERRTENAGDVAESPSPVMAASGAEGPFTGITTPLNSSRVRRTRWDDEADNAADAVRLADGPATVHGRRELALVEGAVVLPLARELLRPAVGTVEAHLLLGTVAAQAAAEAAEKERRRQKRLQRRAESKRAADGLDGAEDSDGLDSDEAEATTSTTAAAVAAAKQQQQLSRLRRGLGVDVKRRGYGVNMALLTTAAPGEQHLVRAARVAAGTGAGVETGATVSATTSPGARMMNVMRRRQSARAVGGETDAAAVQAYLKRLTWLERQSQAAWLSSSSGLSSAGPSWLQMSAAERVRKEMAHTAQERQRFSRKRTRNDDDNDGGADGANE